MKFPSIVWVTIAFACGIAGWILRGQPGYRPGAAGATRETELILAQRAAANNNTSKEQNTSVPTQLSPADQFRDSFRSADPVTQMAGFLQALQSMTKENQPEFLAHWAVYLAQGRPPAGMDRMFNIRMGQVLGASALSNRTGNAKDLKVLGSIKEQMEGAMQTDPDGVRVWFDGLNDEKFREAMLDGYVSGMANRDMAQALRFVGTLDTDLRRNSLNSVVAIVRRNERPEALSAWFQKTAADSTLAGTGVLPELFDTTLRLTLRVRQSIPTAAQLLEEHAGKPYVNPDKAQEVATKYAQENFTDALAWANRMEASHPLPERGSILLAAAGAVQGTDIASAAEWCREHVTGDLKTTVLQQLATNAETADPALASRIHGWLSIKPPQQN